MKTKWSAFCQAEHNPAHTIAFTTNIKVSRSKFDRQKSVQIFLKKSKKSSKKLLHFSIIYGIIANVVQYRYAVLQNKAAKSSFLGGVKGWQSAVVRNQNINQLPYNIILSPTKRILHRNLSKEEVVEKLKQLIKDKPKKKRK
jgi:hypothetical protein